MNISNYAYLDLKVRETKGIAEYLISRSRVRVRDPVPRIAVCIDVMRCAIPVTAGFLNSTL